MTAYKSIDVRTGIRRQGLRRLSRVFGADPKPPTSPSRRAQLRLEWLEPRYMLDGAGGEMMPDFALVDVNETSATYGQAVSPRDYSGQISAWFFGHAH